MGISSKKTTQKVDQTQTENATTTPIIQPWVQDHVQGWAGTINQFGQSDPYSFVAGPSALQQQAFAGAQNLGGWQQGLTNAANAAAAVGAAGPNLAGPAAMASSQGYNPASMSASSYNPVSAQSASMTAPKLGSAAQAAGVTVGSGGSASGAAAKASQAKAVLAGPTERANAIDAQAASMLDNFGDYQQAPTQALVDATLGSYDDQAGRQQAQFAANAAKNKAFGGSRFAIAGSQLAADQGRNRALTEAELRDRAFTQAVGMSQFDATNRQNTGLFNAQNQTQNNQFNSGQANDTARLNAQLGTNTNVANAGYGTQASIATANNMTGASIANANNSSQLAGLQAQLSNSNNQFNAGQQNQFALQQGNWDYGASQFNAGNQQQTNLSNAGWANQAGQFNAGNQQQANMANAGWQNDASQFGANWANQTGIANQNAQNQFAMFNAGQQDNALQNQLAAAGLQGQLANSWGANTINDLGMTADLGQQQWALQQMEAQAPLNFMQAMGNLQGTVPWNMFTGQNVSGTSNVNGTTTTKQSGSMFDNLMALYTLNPFGVFGGGK